MMCKQATESMTEASEGALRGWRRLAYRFHLRVCPYCRAHAHQLEQTVGSMKALPRPEPSDEARERALAAFRSKRNV
jgi:anti-sigma factor ChrR (cupin superfamily)